MRVALVHDYLNEYGGAERVLEVLSEMYPEAPIYTAFYRNGSAAYERFKHRDIRVSLAHYVPFFARKLHSPLRFLAPPIWRSFDFSSYDVVISSSSWYMTKGIRVPKGTLHVSYIHTPPRYLYGYDTSVNWRKYWPVRVYAAIVNKELRQFDYNTAQTVDVLVANSKEVSKRIAKFWRRESTVIYPPVELQETRNKKQETSNLSLVSSGYYLTGGRLVATKHFDLAIQAANELHLSLKVFGAGPLEKRLRALAGPTVELVGKVNEGELGELYQGAKAFIVLAIDEDFGITPVEAMMAGTPVVAYRGGGYLESVVDPSTGSGRVGTGVFVDELTVEGVKKGIERVQGIGYRGQDLKEYAQKFSKERFVKEMNDLVERAWEKKRAV